MKGSDGSNVIDNGRETPAPAPLDSTGILSFRIVPHKSRAAQSILRAAVFLLFIALHSLAVPPAQAVEIRSRAAVVMDSLTGRVLYAKNPDLGLPPASTTKLMTALVVIERKRLDEVVTLSRNAATTAPTRTGLRAGDKVTVETLLYAALMRSANDAAVALAESVAGSEEEFVKMMNLKAIALGANDTRFINANGLPGKGQQTTAYDLSKIMRQAIKYPVLREILGTKITEVSTDKGKTLSVKNTNKLLWSDDEIVGGKTGYTRAARHCFVCAGEREKDTIIVALLGAPSRDLLWKESEELLAFGSDVMRNNGEPVIYLTKSDMDAAALANSSAEENGDAGNPKISKKKSRKARSLSKRGKSSKLYAKKAKKSSGLLAKKRSSKDKTQLAKNEAGTKLKKKVIKKKGMKVLAGHKRTKKQNVKLDGPGVEG